MTVLLHKLINDVIKGNFATQQMFSHLKRELSIVEFAREYKTVHINIGRQTGKTSTIMSMARPGDVVVVYNDVYVRQLLSEYNHVQICTVDDIIRSQTSGGRFIKKYNYVWIDEPGLIENINYIYSYIDADIFIKIGE